MSANDDAAALTQALRDMAQLVPETCRYHGVRIARDGLWRESCCDTGRPAFMRALILMRAGVRS